MLLLCTSSLVVRFSMTVRYRLSTTARPLYHLKPVLSTPFSQVFSFFSKNFPAISGGKFYIGNKPRNATLSPFSGNEKHAVRRRNFPKTRFPYVLSFLKRKYERKQFGRFFRNLPVVRGGTFLPCRLYQSKGGSTVRILKCF